MFLKILFVTLSYLTTLLCIFGIAKFNPSKHTFKKSVLIMTALYSLPAVVDLTLFFIIATSLIPPGVYGMGITPGIAILNLAIFIPTYIILGNNNYNKFKTIYPERKDLRALKRLWEITIVKIIFVISATIWITEVV